ncbi:MAG: hypothetical protein RMH84_02375 [Sulfolobales archaeon]|nr:hypothetical protein [Sulfolobales archaeon]MDW8010423.1 hypothetical protein [Sulfolobales archaeon]
MISRSYARRMCQSEYVAHRAYLYVGRYLVRGGLREALLSASLNELGHYNFWKKFGDCRGPLVFLKIFSFIAFTALFGVTALVKLLERIEGDTGRVYEELARSSPELSEELLALSRDESEHEAKFANSIDETRVRYLSSITLGVADAIIELTGIYAGAIGVLESARTVGVIGLIAGVSASVSMAVASYTQAKHEVGKKPHLAAAYTGISYLAAASVLAAPYFLVEAALAAFIFMVLNAVLVIAYVSVYGSVLLGRSYAGEFLSNVVLLLGVSAALYAIGRAVGALAH